MKWEALLMLAIIGSTSYILSENFAVTAIDGPFSFRLEWLLCSRLLDEGRLYSPGMAYCSNPPLVYYIMLALKNSVGIGGLDASIFWLNASASTISYLILARILAAESISFDRRLLAALHIPLIAWSSINFFETSAAIMFLLAGFHALFHIKHRHAPFLGGALMALALGSKLTVLPLMALILAKYGLDSYRAGKAIDTAKTALALVAPVLAIRLAYPNIYTYIILSHAGEYVFSIQEYLLMMSPMSPELSKAHIAFYAVIASMLYLASKKNAYAVIALGGLAFRARLVMTGGLYTLMTPYYAVPVNAFIILALLSALPGVKKGGAKMAAYAIMVILLAYGSPLYQMPYISDQGIDPTDLMLERPLENLPKGAKILTGYANSKHFATILSGLSIDISEYQIDYVRTVGDTYGIDAAVGPRLLKAGNVKSISKDTEEPFNNAEKALFIDAERNNRVIGERLIADYYDIIISAPPDFSYLRRLHEDQDFMGYRCSAGVFNTYYPTAYGNHVTRIMFSDKKACAKMRLSAASYYVDNFEAICGKSHYASKHLVDDILPMNKVKLRVSLHECNLKNDHFTHELWNKRVTSMSAKERAAPADLARLAVLCALILGIYGLYEAKKHP